MTKEKDEVVPFSKGFRSTVDEMLTDLWNYFEGTYTNSHHYSVGEIQTTDVWDSLGSLDTTARDNAIKYLMRYGKKEGKNKKDLLKAIHYILMLMYNDHYR